VKRALVITLALIGCSRIEPPVAEPQQNLPDLELFGAKVMVTHGSLPNFTVRAPHIARLESHNLMLLDGGVEVDFYDGEGRHTARLTADEGEVLEKENRLYARGEVTVRSDSGMVLLTDELYFDQQKERVFSDVFVTVVTLTDSLSGYGFSSAPDLSDWVIRRSSGTTWRQLERQQNQR